jgi:hypothetical protein
LFCKVRGEKVIKSFLNNEPRYLEVILDELESRHGYSSKESETDPPQAVAPWVERYVILLWLSHLMLAPFPLESISAPQPSDKISKLLGVELPPEAPGITLRVLAVCIERLSSASKERSAAASLLARLCIRPDMQQLGLLEILVKWSVSFLATAYEIDADIHPCLGVLSFLSGLVSSTTNEEAGPYLSAIYTSCRVVLDQQNLAFVRSSAIARKLIVKIFRNIVIHRLQPSSTTVDLDDTSVLEEVIEYLLEAVADGDTPVRYAASKALSIVTLKMSSQMAEDVVEAILGSLNESVYWQGSKRTLSGVSSLRWHGLTLTLSHLLYRKAISKTQLPVVLNALLLSLSFEQRSSTGGSIGTNVRDAACFGLWALSRRYATHDLLQVEMTSIRAYEHRKALSVPQVLAIELITAACLDPAGNIRRGSSAALQELVGRHPNTIEEGISLVQVVDFHAVGLRQRAFCDVAVKAANLRPLYWEALFENLLGWRGAGSLDVGSRLFAAEAVGLLSQTQPADVIQQMSYRISTRLAGLRPREVEERQGLVSALAAFVNCANVSGDASGAEVCTTLKQQAILPLWKLLDSELKLDDKAFTSPALRPELTASSMSNFIAAMASLTNRLPREQRPKHIAMTEVVRVLNLCLARHEDSVLEAVMFASPAVLTMLLDSPDVQIDALISGWLSRLEHVVSYGGVRCSGYAIALGSAYIVINNFATAHSVDTTMSDYQQRIVQVLGFRCTSAVAVEARTVALRALGVLVRTSNQLTPAVERQICSALKIALNDYTITERGDVGSLVRLEALETTRLGWVTGTLLANDVEIGQQVHADVFRLSLEKLDKVRSRAATVLNVRLHQATMNNDALGEDVSSVAYFLRALELLHSTAPVAIKEAIILGVVNSVGMGSETVLQNARLALIEFVHALSDETQETSERVSLLCFMNCIVDVLKGHLDNDRVLIPILEAVAFLFDMQVMHRLAPTSFRYVSKGHLPVLFLCRLR